MCFLWLAKTSPPGLWPTKCVPWIELKLKYSLLITQGLQEKVLPRNLPHFFSHCLAPEPTIFFLWGLLNISHLSLYGWLCTRAMHKIQLLEVYREKETAEFSSGYQNYFFLNKYWEMFVSIWLLFVECQYPKNTFRDKSNQIKFHGKQSQKKKKYNCVLICQCHKSPNMHFLRAWFSLGG